MTTANLFDLDAELGSEKEDGDFDEENGEQQPKKRPQNGAMDDSSEEEDDDEDEEAARQVRCTQSPCCRHKLTPRANTDPRRFHRRRRRG